MEKDVAVSLIRDLADRNGGHISFKSFIKEAGIPEQRLRRESWFPGWNALLQEIGLQTKQFYSDRTSDDSVADAVAEMIKRLKRWPTEDEIVREKKNNPAFPSMFVIQRVKKSGTLRSLLERLPRDDESDAIVHSIAAQLPSVYEFAGEDCASTAPICGYVYLCQHGTRQEYKIGKTNNPIRREGELRVELPEKLQPIHFIETDDPSGIEKYWHNRFSNKRKNGEWFSLSREDISAFKRWKKIF